MSKSITEGSQDMNSSRKLKAGTEQRPRRNAASWLAYSPGLPNCFSITTQAYIGMGPLRVGLSLLYQLTMKKPLRKTCSQAKEATSQLSFHSLSTQIAWNDITIFTGSEMCICNFLFYKCLHLIFNLARRTKIPLINTP